MSELRIITAICLVALAFAFTAGCTGGETEQATVTATETQTATQATVAQSGSTGEYSTEDGLPSDMEIVVSATDVSSDTVLINYNLDLSSMGTAMGHNGWQVLATAYAYNPEKVEPEFSVNSYNDIISAGIPYKTNNIRIFPGNQYPGKTEVSTNPTSGMTIDTGDYYIYGVVLREA